VELIPQAIPDVKLLVPRVHGDARGFFLERWRRDVPGLPAAWAQDNHSRSRGGTLRGLHYQLAAHAQGKLVGVVRGRILDVAVDLRRGSPTFGRWVSAVLDDERLHQLWVPPGFAHGFLVLSEVADVLYKVDHPYTPAAERGVRWDDPTLAIDWGALHEPLVSEKDAALPLLADSAIDFEYQPR
jgi:dTDP-4-dehydrorhamnose 3,5-epimerase